MMPSLPTWAQRRPAAWVVGPAVVAAFVLLATALAACSAPSLPRLGGNAQTAPAPVAAAAPRIQAPAPLPQGALPQPGAAPGPALRPPPPFTAPTQTTPPPGPAQGPPAPALVRPTVGVVRVGLLLPLSGPEQAVGQSLLDAALLAMSEIGNDRITLLPRDTQGTAEGAGAAAAAVLQQGAELILGPVFSAEVAAVGPIAQARNVSVVAFSTDQQVSGNGVYLLGFMPQQQVARIAAFAASRGLRRFAALAPETPYGAAVVSELRLAAAHVGGELIDVVFYTPNSPQMMDQVRSLARYQVRRDRLLARRRVLEAQNDAAARAQLQQLAGLDTLGGPGYDALLIAGGGAELRQLAPLLPFFDIDTRDVRFLGTGLWDDPTLGQEPSLVGGWYAAAPPENAAAFIERFATVYGYRPVRAATLAYDAVALAAALGRDGPADFGRDALTSPSGFAGLDGIFRFLSNGIAERGLAVLEVTARGARVLDAAARTFVPLGN